MKPSAGWMIALVGLLIFVSAAAARAEDDPRFQEARRAVPWTPVYPIGDEQSCHNPRPNQTGVFHSESVLIGGEKRIFRIVVPANYDRNRPIGILLGFQGFHEAEVNYLWSAGFEDYDESAYWISVSMAMRSFTGYDIAVQDEAQNQDLQFFQYVLAELRRNYAIDENRIYATGFSNGANFIQFLGFVYPTLFAAINPNMGCVDIEPRPGATYACIASGGLRDDEYKSAEFNRKVYAGFQKLGLEMQCHEIDVGHFWPSADTSFDPPRQWTETVVDFFMTHPRGFHDGRNELQPPGQVFTDEFNGNGGLDGRYWHKERFDANGVLCEGSVCDLLPQSGCLVERSARPGIHGVLCLTDFIPRPATWRIAFTFNTLDAAQAIYPAAMCDTAGQMVYMRLDRDSWSWPMARSEDSFRRNDPKGLMVLTKGAFVPEPGRNYELVLENRTQPQWRLLDDGRELASGALIITSALLRGCRFGFGVRGDGPSVAFDRVELSQDPNAAPQECNNLLADYFTAFGRL